MSPPEAVSGSLMMEEAERVKGAILDVQTQVQNVTESTEQELLHGIRSALGYPEADSVDDSGLVDARVEKQLVIPPGAVEAVLPLTRASADTTTQARQEIAEILGRNDDRLMVIVGPCSIHDPEAALEYADRVNEWRTEYGSQLAIVMRTYMEKPRSERGWKGLVYDPRLDGSDDINLGLVMTRMIAGQITAAGVPIAVERLNALTPQYLNGLVAYDAIGARNTTDQKAREYASGTSSPVGFKNTPDGNVQAAAEAVVAANGPHAFLGIGMNGLPNQVNTKGNELAHIILRGGQDGPNYSAEHIKAAKVILASKHLLEAIVVDASHANSGKVAAQQLVVIESIGEQVTEGEAAIRGVMIESHLVAGKQKLGQPEDLEYGQSVTDDCSGIPETEVMLDVLARAAAARA